MAMSISSTLRIKRFDGSNFLAWKNRVYTELLCDDLTDLVDKKPTDDQRKRTFGSDKKPWSWVQADARARRIIIEHLDDSMLHYAPTELTAFEVWRRLRTTYNRTSYLQHAYLRRKLSNLQFEGRSDLSSFLKEFDDVIAEIRAGGGKVGKFEDIEAVVTLLAALPASFSPVIASLGEINDSSPVTLEFLKGILLDYDLKRMDEAKSKKSAEVSDRAAAAYISDAGGEAAFATDKRSARRGEAKVRCTYCERDGHTEAKCFQKRRDRRSGTDRKSGSEANLGEGASPKSSGGPRAISFLVESEAGADASPSLPDKISFCGDSGCTRFMIGDRSSFRSCSKLTSPVPVTLADNSQTQATHVGVLTLMSGRKRKLVLSEVLFVPGLRRNLLSVRRIAEKGYGVLFLGNTVTISKDGVMIADGHVENDLYFFDFSILRDEEANLSESSATYLQVHRRMGHIGRETLLRMKQKGFVDFSGETSAVCEACVRGKLCQMPYPTSTFRTSRPLQQIVSDVCEAPCLSHDGNKFFVTFLDVHTHFSVVYMLRHKSEVFERLVEYKAMVRAQFGFGIGSFLCDNGREFINQEVMSFFKKRGVRLITSVAYNHQQNGRAERLNRTLEDRSRTLLMDTSMPKSFWSEAVLCSTFCLNQALTKATDKVPAIEWYGNVVQFHKLRPFGCVCYTHIPKEKRKKFDPRAEKGIMVGYAPLAYRIYELKSKKIVTARNVLFDETTFYRDLESGTMVQYQEDVDTSDEELEKSVYEESTSSTPSKEETAPLRRGSRDRRLPSHLEDSEVTVGYAEALLIEDGSDQRWDEPKKVEMALMHKFDVWDLVPRQPGMKVLRSKWALQEKPDKLKARLVAVGCDERNGPSELFSPVINMTSVKLFLSIVVQRHWEIHQMDVSSAFLHGNLNYEVFMEQAPGFRNDANLVCKLKRAIYGLKVSPKIWNGCINEFFVSSLSFTRSSNDFCLYFKQVKALCIYVLVYVDDLLIASDSDIVISDFKRKVAAKFNVVDLGKSQRFLGMELTYNQIDNVMTLCQSRFINKVAKKFNVESSKIVYTPIEVDLNLIASEADNVNLPFRQLLGCLLYISIISRPDISFSVNYFSRFMNSYTKEHFVCLKRVLVYLLHTLERKLTYTASEPNNVLECFVDADWGSDRQDRKSVSGNVIRVFGNVLWGSKKQSSVLLSSTESEYVALSTFVHDSLTWVLEILKDFQVQVQEPVIVFEDNQSAIHLSENPITSKRSKHIDVRFRYLKEMVQATPPIVQGLNALMVTS